MKTPLEKLGLADDNAGGSKRARGYHRTGAERLERLLDEGRRDGSAERHRTNRRGDGPAEPGSTPIHVP